MVNYFIYAKDFSGSTGGAEYFHKNGLETLKDFKKDVQKINDELLAAGEPHSESKIVYLHWGNECWEVSEDEARRTYMDLGCSRTGTEPKSIIEYLKQNGIPGVDDRIKLLYIITDGCINNNSAKKCFKLNEDMHYETVILHGLNKYPTAIDLSVAASFFKSRCMVYCNYELTDSTDISKEFDYNKVNMDNFVTERDQLTSYIKLKYINNLQPNSRSLQEIDKLKKLRDRLFDELSSKSADKNEKVNLETKDKNVFLREFAKTDWYKDLTGLGNAEKVEIDKFFSALINYIVSEVKSYSFDALKFQNKFNKSVPEEEIVDAKFSPEQEIEFPDIILDDEKGIPVIILTKLSLLDKIIFHRTPSSKEVTPASFSKFKSTMDCPLFLVNDQDVSESIGYFYTLNVYQQLLANDKKTEPRTRKPFHGGLVLTDSTDFDKYNDYILSATYFDGKKVTYNIGLFYFVLWKNCENKEWMDRNVVNQFKNYTMRRISETKCKIGLSSLPLDPPEQTSLPTALWYCLELSSHLFKDDRELYIHERIRGFHRVADYMIEILKFFNYNLDFESIEKRRELFSYVMALKRIQNRKNKVYYVLQRIFKTVNGFLVSELENPSNLYKLNYLKFNHKSMMSNDMVEEKVNLNDYVHLMHVQGDLDASKAGEGTYEICEKTFRPFFAIDKNKSYYSESLKKTRKVIIANDDDKDKIAVTYEPLDSLEFDRVLSLYKLFIDCVKRLMKYPTLPEYTEYIMNRKKFYKDLVTIFPSNAYFDIKNVYERYQTVIVKVEVEEFVKASGTNINRITRVKTEDRVKFSSDNEIAKFIASEELKVNLKKVI